MSGVPGILRGVRYRSPTDAVVEIADALKQQAGTPDVRILIARWMPLRGWRHGLACELGGQPTILLDPRLLRLGRWALRATIAHELGHVALGHPLGSRSNERWTRRDDALAVLSLAVLLLYVPGFFAVILLGWSLLALIAPLVIGMPLVLVISSRHGPAQHDREYEADAYAIRLLEDREPTIALLQQSCPRRGPLTHLEERLAWRIGAHPPNSARIGRAKNVPLPTRPPAGEVGETAH
jgi:Zn-dependent protease with chaperone function